VRPWPLSWLELEQGIKWLSFDLRAGRVSRCSAALPATHPLLGEAAGLLRASVGRRAPSRIPLSRGSLQTRAVVAEQAPPKAAAPATSEKIKIGINGTPPRPVLLELIS